MVDVEPNLNDYKVILGWYSMLFAMEQNKPTAEDLKTFRKFLTMKEAEEELQSDDSIN